MENLLTVNLCLKLQKSEESTWNIITNLNSVDRRATLGHFGPTRNSIDLIFLSRSAFESEVLQSNQIGRFKERVLILLINIDLHLITFILE